MKIAILGAGHGGLAMSTDLKLMGHLLQVGFVFILYSISYLITSLISSKLSSKIEPYKLCIFSMFYLKENYIIVFQFQIFCLIYFLHIIPFLILKSKYIFVFYLSNYPHPLNSFIIFK